jgi:hypothetical protein
MTAQPARQARRPAPASADERAIARSVAYASLFDYPLTLAQLRQTLIESAQTPSQILATYARSEMLHAAIDFREGFFFLRGRADLIHERRRREARSRAFLRRHRTLLRGITWLPYVRMVALSGSIAHLNLENGGDLDLFIVTRGRHVWSVTVLVVILSKLLRRRRTVCANFVIADTRLALDQDDLFTASQVVHLKPVSGADVFFELLRANRFVGRFYPNFHPAAGASLAGFAEARGRFRRRSAPAELPPSGPIAARLKASIECLFQFPSRAVESFCRHAYRAYLRRQAASWSSPEQVRLDDEVLKLHTRSHRQSVMERFERLVSDTFES